MEAAQSQQPPEQPPALTAEQIEDADFYVQTCGLTDVADRDLTFMGSSGTVWYGLGRCAQYLGNKTTGEIREMVLAKLAEQDNKQAQQ